MMLRKSVYYRRNLPHIHPYNATFFITFRLAGSLPHFWLEHLKKSKNRELKSLKKFEDKKKYKALKYKIESYYFNKIDDMLAKNPEGPN